MRRSIVVGAALSVAAVGLAPGVSAQSPGASWDPSAVTGTVTLSGWESSPAEGTALQATLDGFAAAYPNIKVDYKPIPGDYVAAMSANFAARDVPDLFYVNADVAPEWIKEGYLLPLDDRIAASGFDTSHFFPGAASVFKSADGTTYGFPKDFNTIGMAYNTDLVPTPPATLEDLVTTAQGLVGKEGLGAPMCLNPGLDRGLAFLYAQGGELLNEDGTAAAIDTEASTAAVQWYLDLFKDGLGKTASDLGDGWCGDALGNKHAAITFEGGWLDPAMTSQYPDVKYAWAPFPTGSSGSPVTISYTASYSIGADAKDPDAAFVLLTYLTGVDGMTLWTQGGVALPSRDDVPQPAGKEVLAAMSSVARPGAGFMPGYANVQKAFQDEFTNQIQSKTFDAAPVVAATKAAIDAALAGS
ncbi:MAG: sugar ABC transporter substrate-binding protein [Chloroflexota bacterium]